MIDPSLIAQFDQAQAGFRTWATLLHTAQLELMKVGVTQERALDIGSEWITLIAQAAMQQQMSHD